jgi:hypothetical protein
MSYPGPRHTGETGEVSAIPSGTAERQEIALRHDNICI